MESRFEKRSPLSVDANRPFVNPDSIVRKIWGNADTVLLIFAASAAEFALNRAVDWLFFSNELPRDPIGRFISTARFAQDIVFVDAATAELTMNRIAAIHKAVERERNQSIPDWAYRDVLYMLIDYSERAYELLHQPLTVTEQREVFAVFRRLGEGLKIPELPSTRTEWEADRECHLERDLEYTEYTALLFKQYRRHLGQLRYQLLLQLQSILVPQRVRDLLDLQRSTLLHWMMPIYRIIDSFGLNWFVQASLVPNPYLREVRNLDRVANYAMPDCRA